MGCVCIECVWIVGYPKSVIHGHPIVLKLTIYSTFIIMVIVPGMWVLGVLSDFYYICSKQIEYPNYLLS